MSSRSDPLIVERAEGPNDLAVVRQAPPVGSPSFCATFVAPAGWAYDPAGAEGTARLSSHLVLSGAGTRGRRELARFLDELGGTLSPKVDPESAEVTVWGPATEWEKLLGVLADTVLRPRFVEEDLARVRRQLIERQLRELAQPGSRVEREMLRAIFPRGHPYRETGTGDPRSVARISAERVHRFHREHFSGPGSMIVVTGPPTIDRVRREVARRFADLPDRGPPAVTVPDVPRPTRREVRVDAPGRAQVEMRYAGAAIPRDDARYAGAYLATETLGGISMLSRLFARVRSKNGLAYHASSHLESMRWGGYWVAQAGAGADRWSKVVPMLREEVARIAGTAVPAPELALVRESRIGELPLSLESTAEAHELAVEVAYFGLPDDHWKRWPNELRAWTPGEVRRAAEAVFDPDRAVTVLVGPLGAS